MLAVAEAIRKHLVHRDRRSELLEDPVEHGDGLWVGLVAVTPWGPLVRMEFSVSEASP